MPPRLVERTYLQLSPPATGAGPAPADPSGVTIDEVVPRSVAHYRALYQAVGSGYAWRDRLAWTDERLAAYLGAPTVRLWTLREGGRDGGYFELRRDDDGGVELAYFGLAPAWHGRGLGRALLERAIHEAWRWEAQRLWLHTCTLDAPSALPNYLARGFTAFHRETYTVDEPDAGAP